MFTTSLFPVSPLHIVSGFTTSATISLPNILHVDLTDTALGVHKTNSHTTHRVVKPPGSNIDAWEAVFPKGSINPGNKIAPLGGFGFYVHGPAAFHEELVKNAPGEVLMSYEVMFENGWEWQKGGKLPGIYGGEGESAYGCTGGRQTGRCKCFNLRLMWRERALGELYAYLPHHEANTATLLAVPPRSIQHQDYGFSAGRGAWKFESNKWTAVAQRVKMNTVGKADGEIEVYIDGRSVIRAVGLILRDSEAPTSCVQGIHFQTFFGGHSAEWESPRDQRAWFASVSGAILDTSLKHDEL